MADVKWIKIVTDIFDDEKILLIESMPEADAVIVIWFKLLTLAGKINNGGVLLFNDKLPYTDEMLATIFRRPINTVRLAIKTFENFGMVEIINNAITIPNWSKHQSLDQLESKKEYMRTYMKEYREKQKLIAEGKEECKVNSKSNSKANVSSLEEDIELDIESDINKNTKADIDIFFNTIWSAYPKKEGKGQVKDKQKKELYKIGLDEMLRTIERYKKAKAGTDKKYLQMGSTFFNSGYVDYLDKNYQEEEVKPQQEFIPKFVFMDL